MNSVADAERDLPQYVSKAAAVIVGRGFSDDEIAALRKIAGADKIPWFKGSPDKIDRSRFPVGDAPPPTSHMVERARAVLADNGIVPGGSGAKDSEVHDF